MTPTTDPAVQLSEREKQILHLMAQGKTNEQIGRELCLSTYTIKSRVQQLYTKLDAHGRTNAVLAAMRLGLVPTPEQPTDMPAPLAMDGSAPTDPVALLREAARLLRDYAKDAVGEGESPRWWVDQSAEEAEAERWRVACEPPKAMRDLPTDGWYVAADLGENVANWIALMSPELAEPLAAWLESAAGAAGYDLACEGHDEDQVTGRYAEELAVARAIVEAGQR